MTETHRLKRKEIRAELCLHCDSNNKKRKSVPGTDRVSKVTHLFLLYSITLGASSFGVHVCDALPNSVYV